MTGQNGPILDKAIGSGVARVRRRARHDENLATLLGGPVGGDQRARPGGSFDDHDAGRQAADDAVAAREGAGDRGDAERRFAEQEAARGDLGLDGGILQRADSAAAKRRPAAEASRAPPTARVGRPSSPRSPIAESTGGASGSAARAAG